MTNAEVVSRITNGYRFLSKDAKRSRRYILNVAEKHAETLISHKLHDKSLFRESNVWSSISCFELEKKDVYTCGVVEFKSCNKVMRSKKKLSDLIFSRYGGGIRQVAPIDFMSQEEFRPSTLAQFKRDKLRLRLQGDPEAKFFIKDGYIYIPDSDVRAISLELIVVNTFNLSELDSEFQKSCKSAWDYEFKCPDKLLDPLFKMVREEIGMTLQIPEDENPNMDSNIKSRA